MPPVKDPDDDIPEDEDEEYEDDEALDAAGSCPICDSPAGECDHLVASIDRTFWEIGEGAIFAHERAIRDMLESLVALGPAALKMAGAGHALEQVAEMVEGDVQAGMTMGDAISNNFPQLISALSYMLQEDGDITVIESEADEDSSYENLWAEDAEGVVERLIKRLRRLLDEAE
jgi:hypothetical protein